MEKILSELQIGNKSEVVTNNYSGEEIELNPTELAVYDYIKGAEMLGFLKNANKCKDWFLDNNPNAYFTLLDFEFAIEFKYRRGEE